MKNKTRDSFQRVNLALCLMEFNLFSLSLASWKASPTSSLQAKASLKTLLTEPNAGLELTEATKLWMQRLWTIQSSCAGLRRDLTFQKVLVVQYYRFPSVFHSESKRISHGLKTCTDLDTTHSQCLDTQSLTKLM